MMSRRAFLAWSAMAGAAVVLPGCRPSEPPLTRGSDGIVLNDIHSQLNATRMRAMHRPASGGDLSRVVRDAAYHMRPLSIAGGHHAIGGQQFVEGGDLIDMNGLSGGTEFDPARGEIEVGAGMQWPALYEYLRTSQPAGPPQWTFVQKQTGADRLSIGGALAANAHGRGLLYAPFVGDVVAFTLVDYKGSMRRCSRTENAELFRAAIGGYGLLGAVASVRLRLTPRHAV